MSGLTFQLIGSGAVRADAGRGGTCQLLTVGGDKIVIDCGRNAVQSLVSFGHPLTSIRTVLISHLHFDHVCDLAHLLLLGWVYGRDFPVQIYGPKGLDHFLQKNLREAYAEDIRSRKTHGKCTAGLEWHVTEIEREGVFLTREGYTVEAFFTPHGAMPNINYRLDLAAAGPSPARRVSLTSDTEPCEKLTPFAQGADLLCVECSGTQAFLDEREWGDWHMTPERIATLANAAQVKRVVLKHLVIADWVKDPEIAEKMAATVREGFAGEVFAGADGLKVDL